MSRPITGQPPGSTLAAEGITGGCGGGYYCPGNPVTRDQMAVFLLRAKHGSGRRRLPPANLLTASLLLGHHLDRAAGGGRDHERLYRFSTELLSAHSRIPRPDGGLPEPDVWHRPSAGWITPSEICNKAAVERCSTAACTPLIAPVCRDPIAPCDAENLLATLPTFIQNKLIARLTASPAGSPRSARFLYRRLLARTERHGDANAGRAEGARGQRA